MKDLIELNFVYGLKLVHNPEIIKITTIKKKHLEQLPQVDNKATGGLKDGTYSVIGKHEYKVVVRNNHNGQLAFFHYIALMNFFRDEAIIRQNTPDEIYEASNKALESIPQIFAD